MVLFLQIPSVFPLQDSTSLHSPPSKYHWKRLNHPRFFLLRTWHSLRLLLVAYLSYPLSLWHVLRQELELPPPPVSVPLPSLLPSFHRLPPASMPVFLTPSSSQVFLSPRRVFFLLVLAP